MTYAGQQLPFGSCCCFLRDFRGVPEPPAPALLRRTSTASSCLGWVLCAHAPGNILTKEEISGLRVAAQDKSSHPALDPARRPKFTLQRELNSPLSILQRSFYHAAF